MYLSDAEVDQLCSLRSITQIKLYLVAKRYSPFFVPVRTLLSRARTATRRGRLELAELCERRWLRLEVQGYGFTRRVRYVVDGDLRRSGDQDLPRSGDQDLPRSGDQDLPRSGDQDLPRSGDQDLRRSFPPYSSPDLSLPDRSKDPDRPSISAGPRARPPGEPTDGRTDGNQKLATVGPDLVRSIRAEWDLPAAVVEPSLARFLAACAELTPPVAERELRRYLRAALLHREARSAHPAFEGIGGRETFLGRACTLDRFECWRKSPELAGTNRYRELRDEPRMSADERERSRAAADDAARELAQRMKRA